jgi:hypothetical protein
LARFLENKNIPAVYFMNYHNKDKREFTIHLDDPNGETAVRELCTMKTQLVANHGDEHSFGNRSPSAIHKTTLALTQLCRGHSILFVFLAANGRQQKKSL